MDSELPIATEIIEPQVIIVEPIHITTQRQYRNSVSCHELSSIMVCLVMIIIFYILLTVPRGIIN